LPQRLGTSYEAHSSLSFAIFSAGYSAGHAEPTTGVYSEIHCYILSGKKVCDFQITFVGAIDPKSANDVASLLDFDATTELFLSKSLQCRERRWAGREDEEADREAMNTKC
jgi:hypothetical protein